MEEKILKIKEWLGTGCINIFGLPMSGKDTIGVRLAETLGAKFLSSGMIIRAMEAEQHSHMNDSGALIPTNVFYEWVLPYFEREDLMHDALILSSVGRWSGEENQVMNVAAGAGHPIKAAVLLNVSEQDITNRWETAHELGGRINSPSEVRADDANPEIFQKRISEFREKTMPVINHYNDLGLLVPVRADMERDAVFAAVIDALYAYCQKA